jgi:plastocyanin
MNHCHHRPGLVALAVAGAALAASPARAQAPDGPADAPATRGEVQKLAAEVREQRQLLVEVLRLLKAQGVGGAAGAVPAAPADDEATAAAAAPDAAEPATARKPRPEPERRVGTLEGRVSVAGAALGDVYVFVENVRAPSVRNRTIEIRQEGKQFNPRVLVVQTGTSVIFPNLDSIYHNVFSNSGRNAFDLGSYRAGDTPRAVRLAAPGVVDVFCNMHQRMSASILVVPSPLYTKVRADGSFRLDNVPVGQRQVTAWGPAAKPSAQRVDVTAAGAAHASFVLERQERLAHANKLGQPYGSYRD